MEIRIGWDECKWIEKCGRQKRGIFGHGLLVSSRKAAEIRAAEIRAAEIRAAERIELTAEEKEEVRKLDEVAV